MSQDPRLIEDFLQQRLDTALRNLVGAMDDEVPDHTLSLADAFGTFYHFSCSDPRDHVFALLSMIKHKNDRVQGYKDLKVNYTLSPLTLAIQIAPLLRNAGVLRRVVVRLGLNFTDKDQKQQSLMALEIVRTAGESAAYSPGQSLMRFRPTAHSHCYRITEVSYGPWVQWPPV